MNLSDKQLLKELVDSSLSAKNLQRRALAKLITLLESTLSAHQNRADAILNQIIPLTGKSFRLGISGVPGVGKSTLIEALGLYLIAQGHRVAVLAIDPSSTVSGGSILGDKTRMEQLSMSENAFIRPSPTAGNLGGVAEKTRETILLAEAAGFDVVIVETVGVGQSEIAVANMTDMFVLMHLPNAGDDLQAIKKGVMELADLVLINKADIDQAAATRAQSMIAHSSAVAGSGEVHGQDVLGLSAHLMTSIVGSAACVIGIGIAFWMHLADRSAADRVRSALRGFILTRWIPTTLENRWYVDEIYHMMFRLPLWAGSHILHFFDKTVVDGFLVDGTGRVPVAVARLFQPLYNGVLQGYAATMAGGFVLIAGWVFWIWLRGNG